MATAISSPPLLPDSDEDYELIDPTLKGRVRLSSEPSDVQSEINSSIANAAESGKLEQKDDEDATVEEAMKALKKALEDRITEQQKKRENASEEIKKKKEKSKNSDKKGDRRKMMTDLLILGVLLVASICTELQHEKELIKEKEINAHKEQRIETLSKMNSEYEKNMTNMQEKLDALTKWPSPTDSKVDVIFANMPEHMQKDAIDFAIKALDEPTAKAAKNVAKYMKKEFELKYKGTWQCLVGHDLNGIFTEHRHHIFFHLGNAQFLFYDTD